MGIVHFNRRRRAYWGQHRRRQWRCRRSHPLFLGDSSHLLPPHVRPGTSNAADTLQKSPKRPAISNRPISSMAAVAKELSIRRQRPGEGTEDCPQADTNLETLATTAAPYILTNAFVPPTQL